jgi:hypothetical protein
VTASLLAAARQALADAAQLAAMAEEAAVSRLYGGIHFRADNEAGLELGRRVGAQAIAAYRLRS